MFKTNSILGKSGITTDNNAKIIYNRYEIYGGYVTRFSIHSIDKDELIEIPYQWKIINMNYGYICGYIINENNKLMYGIYSEGKILKTEIYSVTKDKNGDEENIIGYNIKIMDYSKYDFMVRLDLLNSKHVNDNIFEISSNDENTIYEFNEYVKVKIDEIEYKKREKKRKERKKNKKKNMKNI